MHMCVHAYVCVVTHYHSGILEQRYTVCTLQRPLVHLSLEAKKQTFLLLFLLLFGDCTEERRIGGGREKVGAEQFGVFCCRH